MPKEYSPFTPGVPVPVEFFVGREAEIKRLNEKAGCAAATGRIQVAYLSGERGIGKSSVAQLLHTLADRDSRMLGLHTFLGGVTSLEEMARRIFDRLLKESVEKTWFGKVKQFFGNHIRQVGVFGITAELGLTNRDLQRVVYDFAPALLRLVQQLKDERRGILLILDDINGLASSQDFANWLKSLVDEIATSGKPLPLCLLLVGLEDRRQSLISLQPSLARVFDLVEIKAWSSEETRSFYQSTFSKVGITVNEDALDHLCYYTGGLPVLAHEIGDAVFKADDDNQIGALDAVQGVLNAAEIVGRKYLAPHVLTAIRSPRYRNLLRKLAKEAPPYEFQRSRVRTSLREEELRVFDSFLRRMTKLGVLVPDREKGPGVYRFTNLLHGLYFLLEGERLQENRVP